MCLYAVCCVLRSKTLAPVSTQVFGMKHPSTAVTLVNIAAIHKGLGEYSHALDYFSQALTARKMCFGEFHPETATSVSIKSPLSRR